jgi:hypothetical protein
MAKTKRKAASTVSPTFAEITAAVPMPPSVELKRRRLDALRDRRDHLTEELNAISAAREPGVVAGRIVDAYREAMAIRRQVDAEIEIARAEHAASRADYVAAVETALAPAVTAAERGVLEAFAQLLDCWSVFDERNRVMRPLGGADSVRKHCTAHQLGLLTRKLIAGAVGGPAVDVILAPYEPRRRVHVMAAE